MKIEGLRPKTLVSYKKALRLFVEFTDIEYVEDIDRNNLIDWIHSDDIQASTKANRYRFMCAILQRFYANGWIDSRFWRDIKIKTPNFIGYLRKEMY